MYMYCVHARYAAHHILQLLIRTTTSRAQLPRSVGKANPQYLPSTPFSRFLPTTYGAWDCLTHQVTNFLILRSNTMTASL